MEIANEIQSKNRRLITRSLVIIVITFGGFFGWSWFATLESAAIAPGIVVVESKRKSIEHLEGGIVAAVYVNEGDVVKPGAALIKIADTSSASRLKQSRLAWMSRKIEYMRLLAERKDEPSFSPKIDRELTRGIELEVETLAANQQSLFLSRANIRQQEHAIISSRLLNARDRQKFVARMLKQNENARRYLLQEINMHATLLQDGYTSKIKLLELKRSRVLLESEIISVQADLASSQQSAIELEQQLNAISQRNRSEIENMIAEVKNDLIIAEADLKLAIDTQQRSIVTSPVNGIVKSITVNAIGEVVSPGEVIMEVVPDQDGLVVEAIVAPVDIDMVQLGQKALIRLSALNYNKVPPVHGEVIFVDADINENAQGEKTGFKVKVKLDPADVENSEDIQLYPGMPAEVYVLLEKKRPLDFLLDPLRTSLLRAFRES
ncbi:HlyD family type I secretion periplasmic adaptor subunit [Vibrio hippocampi]|uniref:Membrane fusion protein (MFP) family protein n=1 Tax=Vibrio hippocampi TaxID=654686 RepID=A0ABM8ZI29_9VIBR|nr:HlyD family type I secretion periplasmic adaptor subunit [Vibrio hippocampi]CAH0526159.1 Type I secretion system membrane fusion protein PrsE [Vibrio hippocampi]